MVYGPLSMVRFSVTKEPPVVRAALCIYLGVILVLRSHRCHPNHVYVLNNKDCNKDDNKGEAEDQVHFGLRYFARL
jgi:hypothetical protein